MVLASVVYACGGIIGQRSVSDTLGPVFVSGALLGTAVSVPPLALVQAPSSSPDRDALLSLLALAVLGNALTVAG